MSLNNDDVDIETARERAHSERTQLVIAEHGNGLPWHPDHYEAEIRSSLRRGAEEFLKAGGLLLVARECASHGEWAGMISRLGLEPRHAQRMMEAARRVAKLPNASRATHLIEAAGTQSKLIELLSLPESEFTELAETGQTGSLRIDGIEAMTRDELRAAIREARDDMSAKDERAGAREREIERLNKELRKARLDASKATPDEAGAKLREKTGLTVLQLRADIFATGDDVDSLRERFSALREHAIQHDINHDAYMGGIISELLMDLRGLRDDFGLPVLNDGAYLEQLRRDAGL
jgi:hypothetical protein